MSRKIPAAKLKYREDLKAAIDVAGNLPMEDFDPYQTECIRLCMSAAREWLEHLGTPSR